MPPQASTVCADEPLDRVALRHVGVHEDGVAAELDALPGDAPAVLGVDLADHHRGALDGHAPCHPAPHALSRAGDDRDLPL